MLPGSFDDAPDFIAKLLRRSMEIFAVSFAPSWGSASGNQDSRF
jgi:hypothetical protein